MPAVPVVTGSFEHLIVDVVDLEGLPGEHRFTVTPSCVWIPGHGGDRDGPTIPDSAAQEAWMRERAGLHESWHLQWDLPDPTARSRFLALLGVLQG
jgi:hypothetical protein